MEFTNDLVENVLNSILYGSIGVSMILGTNLQILWGLVNTLQLVAHTPLYNIPYTAEVLIFLRAVFMVVSFDPVQSENYLMSIFRL